MVFTSDARDYDGRTALHIAVAENKEEIVRYLVSQGANPTLEDRFGRTAFTELQSENSDLRELLECRVEHFAIFENLLSR